MTKTIPDEGNLAGRARTRRWSTRILWIGCIAIVATSAVGIWAYLSPLFFLGEVQAAARDHDEYKLEQLVGFPQVRDDLTDGLSAPFARMFRTLIQTKEVPPNSYPLPDSTDSLAAKFTANLADATMSPTGIENWVADPSANGFIYLLASNPFISGDQIQTKGRYLDFNRYRYSFSRAAADSSVDVDLKRRGPFGWQVYRVTPRLNMDRLAAVIGEEVAKSPEAVAALKGAADAHYVVKAEEAA